MRWIRRMVRTRKMFTKMFTPPRSQLQWKWQMRRGHDENDDESAFVIDLQSQSNKILIYFKISISSPHLLSLLLLRRSHPWGNKFSMHRSLMPMFWTGWKFYNAHLLAMLTVKAKPWCPLSFSMSTVSWLPLELMSHVTTFAPISAYLVNINK